MHSHAVAPESSGAFFLDMGTERCVFQAGGLRNALRASAAVHATDVMVNPADWQVQKKPLRAFELFRTTTISLRICPDN